MLLPKRCGRRPGFLGSRRGSTAIEFAFTLPVLFIMAVGTLELGNFLTERQRMVQAAYEATRVASVGEDMVAYEDIEERARVALENSGVSAEGLVVNVVWGMDGTEPIVTVTCALPVRSIVGMVNLPTNHSATFTMVQRGI